VVGTFCVVPSDLVRLNARPDHSVYLLVYEKTTAAGKQLHTSLADVIELLAIAIEVNNPTMD
jgi:hypothetical protein